MVKPKKTIYVTQHHTVVVAIEANKDSIPPLVEYDSVLMTSPFIFMQQDFVPLRIGRGTS